MAEKRELFYSLPMFGNQFKGIASDTEQLFFLFQEWAKRFDLSNWESSALWNAGTKIYLDPVKEKALISDAEYQYRKLPKLPCVDLTEEAKWKKFTEVAPPAISEYDKTMGKRYMAQIRIFGDYTLPPVKGIWSGSDWFSSLGVQKERIEWLQSSLVEI